MYSIHVYWCYLESCLLFPPFLGKSESPTLQDYHKQQQCNFMTDNMKKHFSISFCIYLELDQPIFIEFLICMFSIEPPSLYSWKCSVRSRYYVYIWNCAETETGWWGHPLFSCYYHRKIFFSVKNEVRFISFSSNYIMGMGELKFTWTFQLWKS